jgi:hypothetical protein
LLGIYITSKVRFYDVALFTANKSEIVIPLRICIEFNFNGSHPTQWGKTASVRVMNHI